jgi:peroxiredoxin
MVAIDMGIIPLIIRVLIAATFSLAAIAKLADYEGAREEVQNFGMPGWAAGSVGFLLPFAELLVAGLLIPISTVQLGAIGAISLLSVFIVAISINLAQGRKPNCNCFGQFHSTPIGWPILIRNCTFIAGAGVVLWQARNSSPMSVVDWVISGSKAENIGIALGAAALVMAAAEAWLTFQVIRQNGRLLLRIDALEIQLGNGGPASLTVSTAVGLPIGARAPAFELPSLYDGSILTLDALLAEKRRTVLIFSDPDCRACSTLLPDIARWENDHASTITIALISRGTTEANRTKMGEHRCKYLLLQNEREVSEAYQVKGTPGAVLIGTDGKVASYLAMGPQAIRALVARTLAPALLPANGGHASDSTIRPAPAELKIGHPAPRIKLPDLNGKMVDSTVFRRRETLVLFWNPSCGFCNKMLEGLRQWEQHRSTVAPHLLIISSGTVELNRAMRLQSPVLLDQGFTAGLAFQVRGTPAAVLVDAEGKIASAVASGAPAVFALANGHYTRASSEKAY